MSFLSLLGWIIAGSVLGFTANICWIYVVYLPICLTHRLNLISKKHKDEKVREYASRELDNHKSALFLYCLFIFCPIIFSNEIKKLHIPHFEKFNSSQWTLFIFSIISYYVIGFIFLKFEEKNLNRPMEDWEIEHRIFQIKVWVPFIVLFISCFQW